jgi:hypothetical protein
MIIIIFEIILFLLGLKLEWFRVFRKSCIGVVYSLDFIFFGIFFFLNNFKWLFRSKENSIDRFKETLFLLFGIRIIGLNI